MIPGQVSIRIYLRLFVSAGGDQAAAAAVALAIVRGGNAELADQISDVLGM